MQKYKRPSISRKCALFLWRRKGVVAAILISMSAWSRADRSVQRDELAQVVSSLQTSPASIPTLEDASPDEPLTLTVRSVGSTGILVQDRGLVRVGDDLEGWTLESLDAGSALLRRGDASARVRSGGVFNPASGAVTR